MDLTWGNANREFVRGDPYNNLDLQLPRRVPVAIAYAFAMIALAFTCTTARGRCSRAWASPTRATTALRRRFAQGFAARDPRSATAASRSRCSSTPSTLECPDTDPTTACATRREAS
jgi:hypothetical protein